MSDLPQLAGPGLPPADGGPVERLVVLLHGYGADGNDLIGLGHEWGPHLPGTAFVSPHAPSPCDMSPMGRQWFALPEISIEIARAGVRTALPILEAFLAAQLAEHGLEEKNLILVGFSQGAMMALSAGLKRPCAAVLSYSGVLAEESPPTPPPGGYPPVLLVHGEVDQVVTPLALPRSQALLEAWGVEVSAHSRPGLGHGIDGEGLRLGLDLLKRAWSL